MPTRIELNVQTGKQSIIELTQAEVEERVNDFVDLVQFDISLID